MCYEINSEIVLANLLSAKERCSFSELIDLKRSIESSITDVYVDVSKNAVFTTIERHPQMFSWEKNEIIKAQGSEDYFSSDYINDFFNEDIEERIKGKVLNILSK